MASFRSPPPQHVLTGDAAGHLHSGQDLTATFLLNQTQSLHTSTETCGNFSHISIAVVGEGHCRDVAAPSKFKGEGHTTVEGSQWSKRLWVVLMSPSMITCLKNTTPIVLVLSLFSLEIIKYPHSVSQLKVMLSTNICNILWHSVQIFCMQHTNHFTFLIFTAASQYNHVMCKQTSGF